MFGFHLEKNRKKKQRNHSKKCKNMNTPDTAQHFSKFSGFLTISKSHEICDIHGSYQTFFFLEMSLMLLTDATPEVELVADAVCVPVTKQIRTTARGWWSCKRTLAQFQLFKVHVWLYVHIDFGAHKRSKVQHGGAASNHIGGSSFPCLLLGSAAWHAISLARVVFYPVFWRVLPLSPPPFCGAAHLHFSVAWCCLASFGWSCPSPLIFLSCRFGCRVGRECVFCVLMSECAL